MNYPALHYVLEDCPLKDGPMWRALLVLAYHADKTTGEAWPGNRVIAREGRMSTSTVGPTLQKLLDQGYIARIIAGSGTRADRWQIIAHLPATDSPLSESQDPPATDSPKAESQGLPATDSPKSESQAEGLVTRSAAASDSIPGELPTRFGGSPIGSRREERREELEGLAPAPVAADSPAIAVGGDSADGNGDRHGRGKSAARALIEELKLGREQQSRARAVEQLADRPRPGFVQTVTRTVAVDAVLVPAPVGADARDPPARPSAHGKAKRGSEVMAA
jgi:hypothetical protein